MAARDGVHGIHRRAVGKLVRRNNFLTEHALVDAAIVGFHARWKRVRASSADYGDGLAGMIGSGAISGASAAARRTGHRGGCG